MDSKLLLGRNTDGYMPDHPGMPSTAALFAQYGPQGDMTDQYFGL